MTPRLRAALDGWRLTHESLYMLDHLVPDEYELYDAWNAENAQPECISLSFPMRLYNPLNGSQGNWAKTAKIRREQRYTTRLMVIKTMQENDWHQYIGRPEWNWSIVLTRISPKKLDSDGLTAAFKSVRDGVADALQFLDDSHERINFSCEWEKGKPKENLVKIDIYRRPF